MKKILNDNLLATVIMVMHLFFVVVNAYDPTPENAFLANWDTYYAFVTCCIELKQLLDLFTGMWWR